MKDEWPCPLILILAGSGEGSKGTRQVVKIRMSKSETNPNVRRKYLNQTADPAGLRHLGFELWNLFRIRAWISDLSCVLRESRTIHATGLTAKFANCRISSFDSSDFDDFSPSVCAQRSFLRNIHR